MGSCNIYANMVSNFILDHKLTEWFGFKSTSSKVTLPNPNSVEFRASYLTFLVPASKMAPSNHH